MVNTGMTPAICKAKDTDRTGPVRVLNSDNKMEKRP